MTTLHKRPPFDDHKALQVFEEKLRVIPGFLISGGMTDFPCVELSEIKAEADRKQLLVRNRTM